MNDGDEPMTVDPLTTLKRIVPTALGECVAIEVMIPPPAGATNGPSVSQTMPLVRTSSPSRWPRSPAWSRPRQEPPGSR